MRKENDNLRKELKGVNEKLNKAIDKNKPKKGLGNESNEGFDALFLTVLKSK